ncbi:MAG: ACP S-malonyltransferase [Sulfurospirillum sp.]
MKYVAIFPGQGSQKIGMGRDFFDNSKIAREMVEKAGNRLGFDFKEILFEKNDKLELTQFAQPSILLVSIIAYKLFAKEATLKPEFFLGHSLGEFSAICSSGALNYLDAIELVYNRGLFMAKACEDKDAGMMVLLGLSDEKTKEIVKNAQNDGKQIWVANYNCDGQIVVAGDKKDLISMEGEFKGAGAKRAMLLNMSVASHCPILQSAQGKLSVYLQKFIDTDFAAPIISNVTAEPYNTKEDAIKLLNAQLVSPVLYKQSIKNIESKTDKFIEFGGSVLKGINKKITKKDTISITDMESLQKAVLEFR